ncbi:glycosyl hydrolase family 43 protein [Coniochaeta sp. 2T2.1]|nr:glycosyl hydrolase family 43 protein [Coniochaeta sp. 2T2.1]
MKRPSRRYLQALLAALILLPHIQPCALPQLPAAHPRHYHLDDSDDDDDTLLLHLLLSDPSPLPLRPILPLNFPDPSILISPHDGTYYAYATAGGGKQVQIASSPFVEGPWTYLYDVDPLPDPGGWTTGDDIWAPDVRFIPSGNGAGTGDEGEGVVEGVTEGTYVMYYSARPKPLVISNHLDNNPLPSNSSGPSPDSAEPMSLQPRHYCLALATSPSPLGPFSPSPEPWACAQDRGGIIDPSGFLDPTTNKRYAVYKIDGNSVGNGGSCGNGVPPLKSTPIMLQEVDVRDGITKVGREREILDRGEWERDGALVEAPSLTYIPFSGGGGDDEGAGGDGGKGKRGMYVLFYSSHCWSEEGYDVNFAVAERVEGPYRRSRQNPLLKTGAFGLVAPGGATVVEPGGDTEGGLVFHANCPGGRCMFGMGFEVEMKVEKGDAEGGG